VQVIWIASYPKSGNTWIRFLLAAYAHGQIKDLEARSAIVLEFPYYYGASRRANESPATLWETLLHQQQRYPTPPPDFPRGLFLKTHLAASDRHPFIERTQRAILVVRNPRDAALSAINYFRWTGEREIADPRAFPCSFLAPGGDPHWKRDGYGTWLGHAQSWLKVKGFPVHLIRYEDLHRDPVSELKRIIQFLEAPCDHARVRRAVELASFENLRKLEEARHDRRASSTTFFFNRGTVGNSLQQFGRDLNRRFRDRFASGLAEPGYGDQGD
jgi:hypothetical protein